MTIYGNCAVTCGVTVPSGQYVVKFRSLSPLLSYAVGHTSGNMTPGVGQYRPIFSVSHSAVHEQRAIPAGHSAGGALTPSGQ